MDDKEPIIKHGRFWLIDNEQKQLWGTLYIDELNEAKLETHGSLIETWVGTKNRFEPREDIPPHTIVGQVKPGGEWVTLIDCLVSNTQNGRPLREEETDWSHQTYLVSTVVEGIGFEKGEEIAFDQALLNISTLPKWAQPNLVSVDIAGGEVRPYRMNVSVAEREDETTIVNLKGEKAKISVQFQPKENNSIGGERGVTSYFVEDNCHLMIERSDSSKMALKSIFSVAGAMLDLLSICCNETPRVTDFNVYLEKGKQPPAKVYCRMRGYDVEEKKSPPYVPLTLQDLGRQLGSSIGGMQGVARWVEVRERYGAAVAFLTSNWYNDRAYNQDQFSRMYAAVESLLARKEKRRQAKMTAPALARFVEEFIPSFSTITKRAPGEWAKKVKKIRDQQVNHSDPVSDVASDGRMLYVMRNILYVAGASFLLKEIGLGDDQIRKYIEGCHQSLLFK